MSIAKLFDYTQPLVAAATVLSVGAIIVAGIGAYTAYDIKLAADNIEVTGSAKEAVVADTARWVLNLEARTGPNDLENGYRLLDSATEKIATYLRAQGFEDFETPAITSAPSYVYPQFGDPIFTGFSVNRQVLVRSGDVEAINNLAKSIEPFSGAGYNVTTQAVELTYSKLDEVRVTLLSKAIQDAQARAEAIAKESGRTVGTLRTSSSGVVQVLPQGGVDISDYGSYDTQSMNKEVMVTVRAKFEL